MYEYEALIEVIKEDLFLKEPLALALINILDKDYPGLRTKVIREYDHVIETLIKKKIKNDLDLLDNPVKPL